MVFSRSLLFDKSDIWIVIYSFIVLDNIPWLNFPFRKYFEFFLILIWNLNPNKLKFIMD